MNVAVLIFTILISLQVKAQTAEVDVTLTPAGSFKVKTTDVHGFAQKNGDKVTAHNIVVDLKNVKTGVALRDTHTKKHLEVEKFPTAELIEAEGKSGKGTGTIKIRNITKKISGAFKVEKDYLVANFPLKLSDFQINDIRYMGVGVEDEVTVTVTVPLKATEKSEK